MKGKLILIPGRSAKQGVGLNKGKLKDEYKKVTTTLEVSFEDMKSLGLETGDHVKISNEIGETNVIVKGLREGKIPEGYAFIPYGPPSSCLFDGETCASGMPESKGMKIDIEFIKKGEKKKTTLPPLNS
jgi:formylmethanofuran dehydrogenase subunit D|tara:strand:- start:1789 stop:2175 length:387 start_codon:yes stop_codon:yes gene_type:complete